MKVKKEILVCPKCKREYENFAVMSYNSGIKPMAESARRIAQANEVGCPVCQIENIFGKIDNQVSQIILGKIKLEDKNLSDICVQFNPSRILDIPEEVSVDFVKHNLIPLADLGDNNYFCYNTKTKEYCKFNIVDEITFKKGIKI